MRKGQTLVAMLITIAIIAMLAVVMYIGIGALTGKKGSPRADKLGHSSLELAKLQAVDEDCRNNLQQLRAAIQIAMTSEEQPPATLQDTKLGQSFYSCPIGHEAYQYNPQTGEVKCPHPGHEKF